MICNCSQLLAIELVDKNFNCIPIVLQLVAIGIAIALQFIAIRKGKGKWRFFQ